MNIQRLKYFCAVAKHLNFSKAAEECHIAQTAMSRSISALETELGFRLFNRTQHYVELTTAGAYFLSEATKIISWYEFAQQSGNEIAKTSTSRISIGIGEYDKGFMRYYVSQFQKKAPHCSIVLREYHYDNILESLLTGQCDVIFTPRIRVEGTAGIESVVISDSEYIIAAGYSHDLSKLDEIEPSKLRGETFISPSDTNMSWEQKNHLSNIFNHYEITPGKILRTNSPIAVIEMLKLGLGVTFLSEDLRGQYSDIKYIKIKHNNPETKCHVAAASLKNRRPIIDEFMEFVKKTGAIKRC